MNCSSEKNNFVNSMKVNITTKEERKSKYNKYKDLYKDLYKKETLIEYLFLKKEFPNVDFDIYIRMKSFKSMDNKMNKQLNLGQKEDIYDIFAKKYIINSENNCYDEEVLKNVCYKFQKALLTKFPKFLKENYLEIDQKNLDFKYKDYIKCPKKNGYKSIHISKVHKENNFRFCSEIQIKTALMRKIEKTGSASHDGVYKNRKRYLEDKINYVEAVPQYMEIENNNEDNIFFVKELNFKESFERFFKISYEEYKELIEYDKNEIIKNKDNEKDNEREL